MRGYIFRFLILFLSVLLQSVLLDELFPGWGKPDLVLILTLYFGFKGGIMAGQTTGFLGGLLEDLASGKQFGVYMLIKTLMGFGAGNLHKKIFTENFLTISSLVFIGTLLKEVMYIIGSQVLPETFTLYKKSGLMEFLLDIVLIEALVNALLAPFIFKLLNKLNLSLEKEI